MNKNKKKKNKYKNSNLFFGVILFSCLLIFILLMYFVNNKESDKSSKIDDIKSESELSVEEIGNMINDLYLIGLEIYNSNGYLDLPKSGSMYYATKSKLRKMGYSNIDNLVQSSCLDSHSILFFDVDNLEQYFGGAPIMVVYDCSEFVLE